jgi:proteasome lid subunit RPN8/RPN11
MKPTPVRSSPSVVFEAEVARRIRQHSRSSPKSEVCGVLIGRERNHTTLVDASIPGANAAQGGAHVTFTQETWEHIYQVKDQEYPDARIVGWYHSHPGFGVFLSEHDLFIQENFFSSPQQIAWVYDPHSDEEGCFGWCNKKVEKLDDISFRYTAELGEVNEVTQTDVERPVHQTPPPDTATTWLDFTLRLLTYVVTFVAGAAGLFWYIQPLVVPRSVAVELATECEALQRRYSALQEQYLNAHQVTPPAKEKPNGPKR